MKFVIALLCKLVRLEKCGVFSTLNFGEVNRDVRRKQTLSAVAESAEYMGS